jgi:sterol 3beta-glucosyltransferase
MIDRRIAAEEDTGEKEEDQEILRTRPEALNLAPDVGGKKAKPSDANLDAALREGLEGEEELVEERMELNPAERQRVRKEKLSERLMEVFGLEEREEVLEEMRCWLLRSVSEWRP